MELRPSFLCSKRSDSLTISLCPWLTCLRVWWGFCAFLLSFSRDALCCCLYLKFTFTSALESQTDHCFVAEAFSVVLAPLPHPSGLTLLLLASFAQPWATTCQPPLLSRRTCSPGHWALMRIGTFQICIHCRNAGRPALLQTERQSGGGGHILFQREPFEAPGI